MISGLQRPMPGEAPAGSRLLFLGVVLAIQFAVALGFVVLFVRSRALRIVGLVAIAFAMLTNHLLLSGLDLLDKAWRRGL